MKVRNLLVMALMVSLPAFPVNAQEPPEEMEMEEEMVDRPFMGPGRGEGMGPEMREQKAFRQGKKPFKNQMRVEKKMIMGKEFGMPPDMEEIVLDTIKRNDPAFAEKLAGLRESNPKKYDVTIGIASKFLSMVKKAEEPGLEKDVVRGISLEYDVRELSLQYEKASDSEKAKIKDSLKTKLNELFDIRAKGQEARIKRMEKEIAELRANMQKRKANKSKIVEQRLNELVGSKDFSW